MTGLARAGDVARVRAGLRQLAIGAAAAGVTFAIGKLLGVALA